jgi:K(+)-stimulated pyrophosphate-energized sodium pump
LLWLKWARCNQPTTALNASTYITTGVYAVLTALATWIFNLKWEIWGAAIIGLLVGVVIGIASDYFTDDRRKPVHEVGRASESGPAFTIFLC